MSKTEAAADHEALQTYTIPLHISLTMPILMAGVPRATAILNGTFAFGIGIGLQVWWLGLPLGLLLHSIAAFLTSKDHDLFTVLWRHIAYPRYMDV